MSFLKVESLSFDYTLDQQKVQALRNVSLDIPKGGFVGLTGPSGSGKTTLLNILGLIEPIQQGRLDFNGRSMANAIESEKNKIRRFEIGFIFQNFNLFPVLSAEENVEYFLARQGLSTGERTARVSEALKAVGLWEHRQKKPLEMSGGQRQRVAVARAVAKKPSLIIADEPTASLDQTNGREILEILKSLNEKSGCTIVVSSHDPMVQKYMKDHVRLSDGSILESTLGGGR